MTAYVKLFVARIAYGWPYTPAEARATTSYALWRMRRRVYDTEHISFWEACLLLSARIITVLFGVHIFRAYVSYSLMSTFTTDQQFIDDTMTIEYERKSIQKSMMQTEQAEQAKEGEIVRSLRGWRRLNTRASFAHSMA